jgi:hypothetical protein
LWRLQEVLEVTVFRKDIAERLLYDIVGASVNESGVLIDLHSDRIGESNRGTNLSGLDNFK